MESTAELYPALYLGRYKSGPDAGRLLLLHLVESESGLKCNAFRLKPDNPQAIQDFPLESVEVLVRIADVSADLM